MPTRPPHHKPPSLSGRGGARGTTAQRGYGSHWQRLRLVVLEERPLCEQPGCNRVATEVDHVVSIAKGGSNDLANLKAYCKSCHSKKTNREDIDRG